MASAPVALSIDEYLRTSYRPDVDFVAGEVQERNVGEYEHGKVQGLLFTVFAVNGASWKTDPVVEQRIRVSPNQIRVCDVAVLRADAPRERVTMTAPLLCIEVLSPEDRTARAKLVLADYLAMGVVNIWLIDPIRRTAFTFDALGLHEADVRHLEVPGTPICVDLMPIFAALD